MVAVFSRCLLLLSVGLVIAKPVADRAHGAVGQFGMVGERAQHFTWLIITQLCVQRSHPSSSVSISEIIATYVDDCQSIQKHCMMSDTFWCLSIINPRGKILQLSSDSKG